MIVDGVNAIILDQHNRVLLLMRQDMPFWVFPGGGIESGETSLNAILREVGEEVPGLNVTYRHQVGTYYKNIDGTITSGVDTHLFECVSASDMVIHLSGEEEIFWQFFDLDKIPANLFFGQKEQIQDVLAGLKDQLRTLQFAPMQRYADDIPLQNYYYLQQWLEHPAVVKNKEMGKVRYLPTLNM